MCIRIRALILGLTASMLIACGGSATIGSEPLQTVTATPEAEQEAPIAPAPAPQQDQPDTTDTVPDPEPVATAPEPAPVAEPTVEPVQTPVNYTVADITDLILITGQSNALGAQTDYDSDLDSPHKRVFAFTDQGWAQANLHQIWDQDWFPRGHPNQDPSNNFAFHMARTIASEDPSRIVGIVLITAPGERIEYWDEGTWFPGKIQQRVLSAINQLPHKSQIDGILWHQGESNAGESDYGQKLNTLIQHFRTYSWFSWDKPFICGETAEYVSVNRQLMALNNNGDPWTGCVSSNGLTTHTDGYHFDAPALRELGRRYAIKYLQMTAGS